MAKKQQAGRITIANIIAIVGIVLLLVFSFLGRSYMSGGELGFDIVIAVAITGFTAFLLWFLIKAKGAENNIDKWKKAELAALVVYIIFAIPASLFGGIMHFFVVNTYIIISVNIQSHIIHDFRMYLQVICKCLHFII